MTRRISLALQGGGAHGAFTWGVLDRLLDDEEIEIAAISGTSAGALNGAAFKAGWLADGRQGARDNLDWLWAQVGAVGDLRLAGWMTPFQPFAGAVSEAIEAAFPISPQGVAAQLFSPYGYGPFWRNPLERVVSRFQPFAGAVSEVIEAAFPISPQGVAAQLFSPYGYGPFWRNPLERVVSRFHYDRVCADAEPRLFVGATNVRTGKARVFSGKDISTEAILASACLPTVFQAVEIAEPGSGRPEAYWDGGYTGNPALFPLYAPDLPDDIVIVQINPLVREEVPTTAIEIQNRINEISFNASLLADLRAIDFVKELIAAGKVAKGAMKDVQVHLIADDALMNELSAATKLVPNPYLLFRLKEAGRAAADTFLRDHRQDLNERPSVELRRIYG